MRSLWFSLGIRGWDGTRWHGAGVRDRWLGLGHGVGLGDKYGGSEPENQTFKA